MKDVSHKIQTHIDKNQYLHATDLVIKSSNTASSNTLQYICVCCQRMECLNFTASLLENDLVGIEGLQDVRRELQSKRDVLTLI